GLEISAMLTRLVDHLKSRAVTGIFTSLTSGDAALEETTVGLSSLMDTWILVRFVEGNGERNRALYVLTSRGRAHSNQGRAFVLTERGIDPPDVYTGAAGVLTGTARQTQEARERAEALGRRQEVEGKQRALGRRRQLVEAQIALMRAELEAEAV